VPPLGGSSGAGFHSNEPLNHCSHYGIEKFPFARIWMDKQSFVVLGKSTALCVNTRVSGNLYRTENIKNE